MHVSILIFFKDLYIYIFIYFYVFLANYVGVTSASVPKPSLTYENEVLFPDSPAGMPELHSVFNSSSSVVVSKGFVWVSHCSRIWKKVQEIYFWNRTIQISYNFGFVTGNRLELLSMAFISTLFFLF